MILREGDLHTIHIYTNVAADDTNDIFCGKIDYFCCLKGGEAEQGEIYCSVRQGRGLRLLASEGKENC